MKRKFNPYSMPPWLRAVRNGCSKFIIPFCIFQAIRTMLLPTTFDVLFLSLLIVLALSIYLDII
ncbi:hypothetical protein [Niallia sp. 01092]|uniref:hypothetical protein n=1 Tax=unclassified Niallia TaxID=2837522 RepID=UPI003FD69C61